VRARENSGTDDPRCTKFERDTTSEVRSRGTAVSPNTTETYRNVLVSNSLNVVHSLCQPEQIGALNPKFYTLNPKLLGWQQPAVGLACNR